MAVRINSCVRGHSGVRISVLQGILEFLNRGLVPCIPLRGTISASGDLSPLSYIAGAICGHPDVKVFDTLANPPTYMSAPAIIAKYQLPTIRLASKEGLGLVNGTAVSAAAGALAIYDAECLAMLAQTNTALTVEALVGHAGSFAPFIHDVIRPHAGQIEAARHIRTMLDGSKLAVHHEEEIPLTEDVGILRQDRYALRTSAQWIGPQLECLATARTQIEVELNSTTDNPLIDVEAGMFHHGGNFQAMAVTSAMDSARICLQNLGKLAFAQVTELINCQMNRGLPANLAGGEPSTNYHCKGLDIHSGAYCAELGFLANPVSSHVQSTEMHNQSVNSMAFVSARKTMEANDILSLLLSTQLYCALQAIDLRIMEVKFHAAVTDLLAATLRTHFASAPAEAVAKINKAAAIALAKRLEHTASLDSNLRFEDAAKHLVGVIMDGLVAAGHAEALVALPAWKAEFASVAADLYRNLLTSTTVEGKGVDNAKAFLGRTHAMYTAVRNDVGVPVRRGDVAEGRSGPSVGSSISHIVEAVRDGRLVPTMGVMLATEV
jgi:phenylalanine ammonia-lyase